MIVIIIINKNNDNSSNNNSNTQSINNEMILNIYDINNGTYNSESSMR